MEHSKKKVWHSWSSGKDSAYALKKLLERSDIEVTGIFTTVTDNFNRVSMHAVREELLDLQAKRLNLPLYKIRIPYPCTNEEYEKAMTIFIKLAKEHEISYMSFGDLYLQDVRDYRCKQLENTGIEAIFPIWNIPTKEVSNTLINSGYKAIITCIDERYLTKNFSGIEYDLDFINSLPDDVDPCGENGEFHSFVYDCPIFSEKIDVKVGDEKSNDGFTFRDLMLKDV